MCGAREGRLRRRDGRLDEGYPDAGHAGARRGAAVRVAAVGGQLPAVVRLDGAARFMVPSWASRRSTAAIWTPPGPPPSVLPHLRSGYTWLRRRPGPPAWRSGRLPQRDWAAEPATGNGVYQRIATVLASARTCHRARGNSWKSAMTDRCAAGSPDGSTAAVAMIWNLTCNDCLSTRRLPGDCPMAPALCWPATRAWRGHAASRLAQTPGLRRAGARPPVTIASALPTR